MCTSKDIFLLTKFKHMKVPFYQIDAFADQVFAGNPAGVCRLEEWIDEDIMQQIAAENKLPATAFFVQKSKKEFEIRWFAINREIPLCGHATMAASYVIFNYSNYREDEIIFKAAIGELKVYYAKGLITLDFPARTTTPIENKDIAACFDQKYKALFWSVNNFIVLFENEEQIKNAQPNFDKIKALDCYGLAITAPGKNTDFVSRYFAPNVGVDEDPVTGSVHTSLFPFWKERLKKDTMTALQLSQRGGRLEGTIVKDRVHIQGTAVKYLSGEIVVPTNNKSDKLEISTDVSKLDIDVIHGFLKTSYWSQNIARSTVEKSIENSLCFGVYLDEQQIGFARVVTDYHIFAYLCDVFILEAYRGRGFSKQLMHEMINFPKLKDIGSWVLGTRDAQGLYEQFGFKSVEPKKFMKLKRV